MHWAAINNLGLSACYTALSLWLNIFVLSEQTHNDTWERNHYIFLHLEMSGLRLILYLEFLNLKYINNVSTMMMWQ